MLCVRFQLSHQPKYHKHRDTHHNRAVKPLTHTATLYKNVTDTQQKVGICDKDKEYYRLNKSEKYA